MSVPVKQCTFAGGEISPTAFARSDLALYEKSARIIRNMICMKHGGVTGRPGTMYVGTTLNGGNPVRLIPFVFNETGLGQSYVLEFGNQYIAFYQNGGVVISAPNTPYQIASPYLQADLQNLKFGQSADIITIVHPNYAPYELARFGAINWVLSIINFSNKAQNLSSNVAFSGGGSGTSVYTYVVTPVDGATGDEMEYERAIVHGEIGTGLIATLSPTNPGALSWGASPSAAYYKVYRSAENGSGQVVGFIGQTSALSFSDPGFTPDFTNSPPHYSSFGTPSGSLSAGNYPSSIGYVQQRRAFASTLNNPIGFWMSQPGSYSNFAVHLGTPLDSDAIIGSLSGEEVNQIQALLELKFALILTAGAEIYVQGNGSGVVTPSSINASVQSQYGSNSLRPLKVGDILIFSQSLGSKIRDFAFDFSIDGYRGNDISIYAAHLFEGYQIVDWCYQREPDSIIWAVRSDGELLSCTYIREQQVLAWTHHDLQGGLVENVCAIPENGAYAVYASVRRTIGFTQLAQFQIVTGLNDSIDFQMVGGQIYSIFIPAGSYTSATLAAAIAVALNALNIPSGAPSPILWVCSYNGSVFDIGQNNSFPHGGVNYRLLFGSGIYASRSACISLGWPATDTGFSSNPGPNAFDQIAPNSPGQPLLPGTSITRYIERLSSRIWQGPTAAVAAGTANAVGDPVDAPFCDCFAKYDGRNTTSQIMELTTPSGGFSIANTAYQQQILISTNVSYFTNQMVGDQIFLQDAEWISSLGVSGNQLRCTIQSITNTFIATITPSGIVPTIFQNQRIAIWAHAVQTVSGLIYLAGQQVSVWADRFVVGSPLNNHYSTVYTVPLSGILTLDKPYSVIYVGLPMIQDIETLDLETYFGETILGRRKRVAGLTGYIYKTRSFYAGSENPDTNNLNSSDDPLFQLFPLRTGMSQATYDQPPPLLTAQDYLLTMARWNKNGGLFMRNVDPIPWTLLAVSPKEEDPVQTPYKRP